MTLAFVLHGVLPTVRSTVLVAVKRQSSAAADLLTGKLVLIDRTGQSGGDHLLLEIGARQAQRFV